MTRKGKLAEILSKALHFDTPDKYQVGYVDLGTIKNVTLAEFLKMSENFEVIPATRIVYIKKGDDTVFSRTVNKKEINDTSTE